MRILRPLPACAIFIMLSACPLKESIVWLNDPLDAEEHISLGAIYERQGNLDQAEEQYLLAIKKDKDLAFAWSGLGNIYMAKGKPEKAMKNYSRALNLEPDSPDILNNFAVSALSSGKLKDAEEAVEMAISLHGPNMHYYFDTRGQIRLKKNDYTGARDDFCRALEFAPEDDEAFREELTRRLERTEGTCK